LEQVERVIKSGKIANEGASEQNQVKKSIGSELLKSGVVK